MKSFKVICLEACREHVYLSYISPINRFNLLLMRTSQYKKADNFLRNAQGGHLVFQNEANFSPREVYLPIRYPANLVKLAGVVFSRVLTSKISLCAAAVTSPVLTPSIHWMHLDTMSTRIKEHLTGDLSIICHIR